MMLTYFNFSILRTGLTFSFNCNVILGPSLETEFQKFYVIMGMRGNIVRLENTIS